MRKVIRFLVVGAVGVAINIGTFSLLMHVLNVWYVLASAVAFTTSTTICFFLQKFWTYENRDKAKMYAQMVLYFAVGLFNLAISTEIVYLLVTYLSVQKELSQAIAALLVAISSFFIYKVFIFANKDGDNGVTLQRIEL